MKALGLFYWTAVILAEWTKNGEDKMLFVLASKVLEFCGYFMTYIDNYLINPWIITWLKWVEVA